MVNGQSVSLYFSAGYFNTIALSIFSFIALLPGAGPNATPISQFAMPI